jgi:hypothetical protein
MFVSGLQTVPYERQASPNEQQARVSRPHATHAFVSGSQKPVAQSVSVQQATQASPQITRPASHRGTQTPASQLTVPSVGAVQVVGQAPQCAGSLLVSTQVPPQLVSPAGQSTSPPLRPQSRGGIQRLLPLLKPQQTHAS